MNNRPIAFFDIDRTLYNGRLFFDVLEQQKNHNIYSNPEAFDEIKQAYIAFKNGSVGYEATMIHILEAHAKTLIGQSSDDLLHLAKTVCAHTAPGLYPFTYQLLDTFRPSHDIVLVSGEPQYITRAFAEMLNLEYFLSSRYKTKAHSFTGEVEVALAESESKKQAIGTLLADHPYKDSFAFGDSEGDIAMLASVEHAICLHPSEKLQKVAAEHNWHIATDENVVSLVEGLKKSYE